MAHATVSRCLARRGMSRRPAAPREAVRRFEWPCPGDLLQMDTKRLARFSAPGHAVTGDRSTHRRREARARRAGSSVTRSSTTTPAWPTPRSTATRRPRPSPRSSSARWTFFAGHGITARAPADRQRLDLHPQPALRELLLEHGIQHRRSRPAPPSATARSSATSRPSPANGPTDSATAQVRRPSRSAAHLARALQHHQKPQLARQPAAHHPRSEPPEAQPLARATRRPPMHGRNIASFIVRPGAGRSGRSRILLRAAVGCALVLVVTGRGGPSGSSVSMAREPATSQGGPATAPSPGGSTYTLVQMNLCAVRLRRLLREGRLPVRRGRCHRTDPRSRPGRRDAQRGAAGGDVARIARRTGYHLRFSTVTASGRPLRCVRPGGRGRYGDAVLTKAAIERTDQPRLRGAGRHGVAPVAVRRPREPASTCAPPTSPCARQSGAAANDAQCRRAGRGPRTSSAHADGHLRGRRQPQWCARPRARLDPDRRHRRPSPGTPVRLRKRRARVALGGGRADHPHRPRRPAGPRTSHRAAPTSYTGGVRQRRQPEGETFIRNVPFPRKPPDLLMAESPQ